MKTFVELIQDNTDTFDKQINVNFLLKIKYNQNHDIQGTIQWLDQKKTVVFRSLMELILLLQEATSSNVNFRNWNSKCGLNKELTLLDQPTGSDSERG